MSKTKELLTSRKFWAALSAAILGVWGMVTGEVSSEVAVPSIMAVIALWMQAQSRVDSTKKNGGAQ